MLAAAVGLVLTAGLMAAPPAAAQPAATTTAATAATGSAPDVLVDGPRQAADEPPDLDKFQKVVLGQGTHLGEVMELTVAKDGRVFFITRAGDIQMYDPTSGAIEVIMNNPELGVWSGLEDGGLGITLDPAFDQNGWVYVYYAPLPESHKYNRLSRLTLDRKSVV